MQCLYCKKNFKIDHVNVITQLYLKSYCSNKCFINSDEYKIFIPKLKYFYESLDNEQKLLLWSLWDNGILLDEMYESAIDEIIINNEKEI